MNKKASIFAILLLVCHPGWAQITIQNDSLFSRQQELFEKIEVFKAWETTKGNPGVLIGCIDNGFDFYTGHGRINFAKTIHLVKKQK